MRENIVILLVSTTHCKKNAQLTGLQWSQMLSDSVWSIKRWHLLMHNSHIDCLYVVSLFLPILLLFFFSLINCLNLSPRKLSIAVLTMLSYSRKSTSLTLLVGLKLLNVSKSQMHTQWFKRLKITLIVFSLSVYDSCLNACIDFVFLKHDQNMAAKNLHAVERESVT